MAEQQKPVQLGCIYLIGLGVVCSGLLIVNIIIVGSVVDWFHGQYPVFASQLKLQQIIRFVVPIVMIFLQFWLFDYFRDKSDRRAEMNNSDGSTISS